MVATSRLDQIVSLVEERGFLTVNELSRILEVSEMTIRRDLSQLDAEKRLQRTYGGATPLRSERVSPVDTVIPQLSIKPDVFAVDQVDVLVATSVNAYYDNLLLDRVGKKNIPIIAESMDMPNQETIVAVDNYQAGWDLGFWTGQYMARQGMGKVYLLDLSFHKPNTQARSRGFIDGLNECCPASEVVLSINAQSRSAIAYQLARDALTVHPQINLIFAINDSTALGAIRACHELEIDPARMNVVTFGLEGSTLKNALMERSYCKAGLAMFPEIVSLTCIEAAIAAYNRQVLPAKYTTPHVVLDADTLTAFYQRQNGDWKLNWDTVRSRLNVPIQLDRQKSPPSANLPHQIGLIVPFSEHEWYKNLTAFLQEYAGLYGIGLKIIDAEQNVRDEVEERRRAIAVAAVALVKDEDVVMVDCGPIAHYLAEELRKKQDITVITNSVDVFNTINPSPGIVLISTGGLVRYNSQMLVGPTAESALKELRADKLFLMVSGITLEFGLSHTTVSEVTMKQAMIHSAREVILLADHTSFTNESTIQVAPLKVVNTLITDDALNPSVRLDISKQGIRLILAEG